MAKLAHSVTLKIRHGVAQSRAEKIVKHLAILEALVVFSIGAVLGTMGYFFAYGTGNLRELIFSVEFALTLSRTLMVCFPAALVISGLSYLIAFACHAFFRRRSHLIISLLISLYIVSPYFVLLGWRALWSADGLLSGLPGLRMVSPFLGYGSIAIIAVLTARYLPIGVLLVYLRIIALPLRQIQAAQNLGLRTFYIHTKIYLRWAFPAIALVFLFAVIFGSLDNLASSIAGGGDIQIISNILDDWQRSQLYQGLAMGLGLFYTAFMTIFLFVMLRFFTTGVSQNSRGSDQEEGIIKGKLGHSFGMSAIITIALIEISLVVGLLFFAMGGHTGTFPTLVGLTRMVSDGELLDALLSSALIGGAVSLLGTGLAMLSVLARHIREGINPQNRINTTASDVILLIPLVIPPLLGGIAAGAFQGRVMGFFGSSWSIVLLHTVTFSPLAYFVILAGIKKLPSNSYRAAKNLGLNIGIYASNIFLPACRSTVLISILLVFTFSLNESVMVRYVGGTSKPFGVLIANKQMAALDVQHYWAVILMFILCLVVLLGLSLIYRRKGTIH